MQTLAANEQTLYNPINFKFGGMYTLSKNGVVPLSEQNGASSHSASKTNKASNEQNSSAHKHDTHLQIQLKWQKTYPIGPGLRNAGNTCFLNAALQCITYTAPLSNYLLTGKHTIECPNKGSSLFCAMCFLEDHVNKCFPPSAKVISPNMLLRNIKLLNKRFRLGRQEDSHEFIRLFIDMLQKNCLGQNFKPATDQKLLEKTIVFQTFAGKLKSSVECHECHYKSEIFETIYDLCLVSNLSLRHPLDCL
jgi:ubiquitin carboxyl-terminal hydrolase 36/42